MSQWECGFCGKDLFECIDRDQVIAKLEKRMESAADERDPHWNGAKWIRDPNRQGYIDGLRYALRLLKRVK